MASKLKTASGILGFCFEPYVGPWDSDGPVLFNAYHLSLVNAILAPVASSVKRIRTYGQGTFVWQDKPRIQDSNQWNIQAAQANGINVSAGCFQQGADPGGDSINVDWTKTEIDYAIDQAKQYKNVTDLIVGNECIWGPNSTDAITTLIGYAKTKRDAAGFTSATMPITTCQVMGVLCGVNNKKSDYAPTQKAIKKLLGACETFVYANAYAYFDKTISSKLANDPDQEEFTKVVKASMSDQLDAINKAFKAQKIKLAIRLGETGWPTKGSQPAQRNSHLANFKYAKWYYDAMGPWMASEGIEGYVFELYDEPWKGTADGKNSESHFGVRMAEGTSANRGQYTLINTYPKYDTTTKTPPQ